MRTAPRAKTSTTSLPTTKRAMSKSWIVMSRKIPPDPRTYALGRRAAAAGGVAGRRGRAAGDAGELRLPDRPIGDGPRQRRMRRVEAPVEADLEQDARLLDRG